MGIDPAPFWVNLYLYKFENNFMMILRKYDIVKSRKIHGCARFIDDLVCLNDGGEFNLFNIFIRACSSHTYISNHNKIIYKLRNK